MRRAWQWWGVWVVVVVCLTGAGQAVAECRNVAAKSRVWFPNAKGQDWTWKDADGCVRTRAELEETLRQNRLWFMSNELQGEQADLTGADLRGADLTGADLGLADLTGALLWGANLTGANLFRANLAGAQLVGADLTGAQLTGTDLTETLLNRADLTGANLIWADLSRANLEDANLSRANFAGAYLDGANYEPKEQPAVRDIAYAVALDQLAFRGNPAPMVGLRKAFQEGGFVQQGRQVTASIRRSRLRNERSASVMACDEGLRHLLQRKGVHLFACASAASTVISWAAFDWTCAWGADWSHPLVLLGWLCLVCGPMYWVAMHFRQECGIYQIVLDKVVMTKDAKEVVSRVEPGVRWVRLEQLQARSLKLQWRLIAMALRAEWRALRLAFLFSVLSALDIGFHEFNVGQWARMLLARDFNLKARGWMRVAGGVQSLVGLGLVALSLLSYFGHPFD